MIDLDEEQARMESMLERRERMALGVTCAEMIELITRLRQAEKDAERYSFIKQWNQSYSLNVYRKDLWDDVVDKAMWMESQCSK